MVPGPPPDTKIPHAQVSYIQWHRSCIEPMSAHRRHLCTQHFIWVASAYSACGKCKFCFMELSRILFPQNIFDPWLNQQMRNLWRKGWRRYEYYPKFLYFYEEYTWKIFSFSYNESFLCFSISRTKLVHSSSKSL